MIDYRTTIMAIINFLIFLYVYKYFFHEKVNKILLERSNKIDKDINEAKKNKVKSDEILAENKKLLVKSKKESKLIVEEYKTKAQKVYEDIVMDAKVESKKIIERANLEIEREKVKLEEEIKNKSIDLAITLSTKVLEKSIDEEEHRRLIDDFISKVGI
ncbi:F0F1 ATP synthase subunit B [Clostridium grantii]|uniref:ATP synthase subunit b n=1 Tax=Clostridium grantii DSM 8605 TaxID=1121316 RepID=A0A1M5TJ73_9CLOT|nr:F0F1 ATP synthase subunit B [Clostridium grantii]SHH50721.1 F-type H+-transporting ATPase subunit b [Clostridium grantii DSM 8605]